jgi:RNA polymerase sigma-70 factor, ECF subfamily
MAAVTLREDSLVPSAPRGVSEAAPDERALEQRWVEQAMEGDARAFREIVERHHRGMFRLALRMLRDREEAEDVVQESFARAYRCLDGFDPAFRLSTWLYRIALNVCRDHLKSPRRRERPDGLATASWRVQTEDSARADVQIERVRKIRKLHEGLKRLSPSYREALVLKDLEELSYEEMRTVTGSPVTALKIRVVRARAKLRTILEEGDA